MSTQKQRRTLQIHIRATPNEKEMIRRQAKVEQCTMSDYIITSVVRRIKEDKRKDIGFEGSLKRKIRRGQV